MKNLNERKLWMLYLTDTKEINDKNNKIKYIFFDKNLNKDIE